MKRSEYLESALLIVVEDETSDRTGEDDVAAKEGSTWRKTGCFSDAAGCDGVHFWFSFVPAEVVEPWNKSTGQYHLCR